MNDKPTDHRICGVAGMGGKNDGAIRELKRQSGTSVQLMSVVVRSDCTQQGSP